MFNTTPYYQLLVISYYILLLENKIPQALQNEEDYLRFVFSSLALLDQQEQPLFALHTTRLH